MNLSEEELPKALQKHAEEENVKNNSTDNKKKKSKKIWLRILITIIILGILGISTLAFLLYGPYSGFREWLITSAMTTMRHQYLATWFYSDETIQEVLENNKVHETNENTDASMIVMVNNENTNNNNEQQLQQEQEIITKMEEKKESLSDIELKIWNAIEANLDSITKSQKYVFKISDAIKYFNLNEMTSGIVLSIMAIISIAFTIIIANPLVVAGKRYFIKAREKSSTKISVIGEIFKNKNWINVSVTIFLKDIYNFLWYFTIIGRIYKEL